MCFFVCLFLSVVGSISRMYVSKFCWSGQSMLQVTEHFKKCPGVCWFWSCTVVGNISLPGWSEDDLGVLALGGRWFPLEWGGYFSALLWATSSLWWWHVENWQGVWLVQFQSINVLLEQNYHLGHRFPNGFRRKMLLSIWSFFYFKIYYNIFSNRWK